MVTGSSPSHTPCPLIFLLRGRLELSRRMGVGVVSHTSYHPAPSHSVFRWVTGMVCSITVGGEREEGKGKRGRGKEGGSGRRKRGGEREERGQGGEWEGRGKVDLYS